MHLSFAKFYTFASIKCYQWPSPISAFPSFSGMTRGIEWPHPVRMLTRHAETAYLCPLTRILEKVFKGDQFNIVLDWNKASLPLLTSPMIRRFPLVNSRSFINKQFQHLSFRYRLTYIDRYRLWLPESVVPLPFNLLGLCHWTWRRLTDSRPISNAVIVLLIRLTIIPVSLASYGDSGEWSFSFAKLKLIKPYLRTSMLQ